MHTSWSFDAYIFGNTITGPEDAYKYAKGGTIEHPQGYNIKITTPLDWMGVTDHSEYVGTIRLVNTPGSSIDMRPIKELVVPQVAGTVWKEMLASRSRPHSWSHCARRGPVW